MILCACCRRCTELRGDFSVKRLLNFHDEYTTEPDEDSKAFHHADILLMNTPLASSAYEYVEANLNPITRKLRAKNGNQPMMFAADAPFICRSNGKRILRVGILELRESFSRSQPSDELRSRIKTLSLLFRGPFLSPAARN